MRVGLTIKRCEVGDTSMDGRSHSKHSMLKKRRYNKIPLGFEVFLEFKLGNGGETPWKYHEESLMTRKIKCNLFSNTSTVTYTGGQNMWLTDVESGKICRRFKIIAKDGRLFISEQKA